MAFVHTIPDRTSRLARHVVECWGLLFTESPRKGAGRRDWDLLDELLEEREFGGLWWW